MSTATATIRSWVEGPRFAKLPLFIRKTAASYNLECSIEVEKGWIRETVFYTVTGLTGNIRAFDAAVNQSMAAYNQIGKEESP